MYLRININSMKTDLRLSCHLVNVVGCIDAVFKQNLKHVCLEKLRQIIYWNFKVNHIIIETNVWIHWSRRVFVGASRSVPHGCRPMPTDPSLRQNATVATTGSASLKIAHLPVTQHEQICEIYTFLHVPSNNYNVTVNAIKRIYYWVNKTNVLFSIKTVNERICIDDRK